MSDQSGRSAEIVQTHCLGVFETGSVDYYQRHVKKINGLDFNSIGCSCWWTELSFSQHKFKNFKGFMKVEGCPTTKWPLLENKFRLMIRMINNRQSIMKVGTFPSHVRDGPLGVAEFKRDLSWKGQSHPSCITCQHRIPVHYLLCPDPWTSWGFEPATIHFQIPWSAKLPCHDICHQIVIFFFCTCGNS